MKIVLYGSCQVKAISELMINLDLEVIKNWVYILNKTPLVRTFDLIYCMLNSAPLFRPKRLLLC